MSPTLDLVPHAVAPTASRATDARVADAVAALVARRGSLLLAVSGGVDSMVLLHAVATCAPERIAAVATFDHRSGPHAGRAARFVRRQARALGLRVVVGRAAEALHSEAGWRAQRWRFLEQTAARLGAAVVTAHNRDDAIETVCMRVLRGAGARGLAALYAESPVERPLLGLGRAALLDYARAHDIAWIEDPTNQSPAHLRNRLRRDLLPAIARTDPSFGDAMLELSRRAADWRARIERHASSIDARVDDSGALRVAAASVAEYDAAELAVLWPALAARARLRLDRRGTRRLAEFTISGGVGRRMQLSGGVEVARTRDAIVLHRPIIGDDATSAPARLLGSAVRVGRFRFMPGDGALDATCWAATLPADAELVVRRWTPGDRMRVAASRPARRVKRFLSEAGVPVSARASWPVVLADGEIVWVPGVCRSDAASDRSGRPGLRYVCERYGS